MKHLAIFLLTVVFFSTKISAQVRQATYNNIGWFGYFGDHKISKKWGLHTEYQWRRAEFVSAKQQSLARIGINYQIHPKIMLTVGYGLIHTYSYGELPISRLNDQGEAQVFLEHRIYEDLLLNNDLEGAEISHRFRLEQRYVGLYYDGNNNVLKNQWKNFNRLRYRVRVAIPFKGKTIDAKEQYFVIHNEIFVGFGKDVGYNVFDQNRLNIGIGYKINKHAKIEAGYFSQILQKSRLSPTSREVFEYNQGFLIGIFYNFDFSKKDL